MDFLEVQVDGLSVEGSPSICFEGFFLGLWGLIFFVGVIFW